MNTFIILFVLLLGSLFVIVDKEYCYFKNEEEKRKAKKREKIYFICAAIILLLVLFIDIRSYTMPYTIEKTSTEKIVALQDSNNVDGRFYLRRGTIETKLYYNYMVSLVGGGYKANKVPSKETTLYTVDDNYRVEWWEKKRGYGLSYQIEKYWKIYIPKNSIVEDYTIDLQ